MDFPYLPTYGLRRELQGLILSRAARLPGVVLGLAKEVALYELRVLRSDLESVLAYIEHLPSDIKKAVAYEFFAGFFSHYVPKKLLRRYIYGGGSPPSLILTEREMIDCNPYISVLRCRAFRDELAALEKGAASTNKSLELRCPAGALTNGTLGQFTVKMKGVLSFTAAHDWKISGVMSFYDEWDFDPKDFTTGGRSFQGEIKTRFAYYTLPGDGFEIESVEVPFSQASSDSIVVWKGGPPVGAPDRIAEIDLVLKKAE